mgnify:CR=1 FL=1
MIAIYSSSKNVECNEYVVSAVFATREQTLKMRKSNSIV